MNVYSYFGLTGPPFHISPNPEFAYETASHRMAIVMINYSVTNRRGLFLLEGAVGTGKTTLSRFLIDQWAADDTMTAASIISPTTRSQAGFMREIVGAFGQPEHRNLAQLIDTLILFLVEQYRAGKTVVLMLDDAQGLSLPNLDLLHTITNKTQSVSDPLLQIVLMAQPAIRNKLDQRPALLSRITGGSPLGPLPYDDAMGMLRHRTAVAGGDFDAIFEENSHRPIYNATQGVCRDLCVCADQAMVRTFAAGRKTVTAETIKDVINAMAFKGWQLLSGQDDNEDEIDNIDNETVPRTSWKKRIPAAAAAAVPPAARGLKGTTAKQAPAPSRGQAARKGKSIK